jgi:hypothetical protein
MQIFSRQAAMMDALISHFADQMRRRKDGTDAVDNVADDGECPLVNFNVNWRLLLPMLLVSFRSQNQIQFRIMDWVC